jgi:hypothetical protein
MKRKSKREMVLDIYDQEAMGEVTAREIAIINQALIDEFGEGGAMAPAEIARILTAEELPVRFEQVFRMMTTTERYENLFHPLAENSSLVQAEASIRRIDFLFHGFERQGDKTGTRFALETARLARKNAEEQVQSPDASSAERDLMAEIAQWFAVWLQSRSLFDEWLALRKSSKDFQSRFEPDAVKGN